MFRKPSGRTATALRVLGLVALTAFLTGAASGLAGPAEAPLLAHVGRTRLDPNVLLMSYRGQHFVLTYESWPAPVQAGPVRFEGSVRARPLTQGELRSLQAAGKIGQEQGRPERPVGPDRAGAAARPAPDAAPAPWRASPGNGADTVRTRP